MKTEFSFQLGFRKSLIQSTLFTLLLTFIGGVFTHSQLKAY
jgi:hypothetical protein